MEAPSAAINTQIGTSLNSSPRSVPDLVLYAIYALSLAASIGIWLLNIRAPLWLDETVSIYLIRGGFAASSLARFGRTLPFIRACSGCGPRPWVQARFR